MENNMNVSEIIESGQIPEAMNAMFVTVAPNAPSEEYAALGGLSCADWAKEAMFPNSDFVMGGIPSYRAIATTEHATSSYGLPVVVLPDGTPIGPQDRVFRSLSFVVVAAALNPLFGQMKMAGYNVEEERI